MSWRDASFERVIPRAKGLSEKWAKDKLIKLLIKADKMGWDFSNVLNQFKVSGF